MAEYTLTEPVDSVTEAPSGPADMTDVRNIGIGNAGVTTSSYGPVRHYGPTALTDAMRRSAEMLDMGSLRMLRTPYQRIPEIEVEQEVMFTE